MKKVTPRDILLTVAIIGFIVFMYTSLYFKGELDEKLPNSIKKENIEKKVEKVKDIISLKKENRNDDNDNKIISLDNPKVVFETNKGNIEIELYKKKMPVTADNFIKLVKNNFYDGVRFHRIIKDFMIQAGDPNSKDLAKKNIWGQGGPGYVIKDEFVDDKKLTNDKYTIAMANSGPNSGGSQFFINTVDNNFLDFNKQPLTSKHPVFGKVVKGFDVVDEIENSKSGDVVIKRAYIK